jgi:hypothetical protein
MDNENEEILDAEVQDDNTSVEVENNDTLKEESSELENKYLNQKGRAEAAEKREKALKAELEKLRGGEQNQEPAKDTSNLSTEDVKLYARYDDEAVDKIKKIATVEGISYSEAIKSDLFTAYEEVKKQEAKRQKASLGASRGSSSKSTVNINTPGIGKEDHKALWKKKMGM